MVFNHARACFYFSPASFKPFNSRCFNLFNSPSRFSFTSRISFDTPNTDNDMEGCPIIFNSICRAIASHPPCDQTFCQSQFAIIHGLTPLPPCQNHKPAWQTVSSGRRHLSQCATRARAITAIPPLVTRARIAEVRTMQCAFKKRTTTLETPIWLRGLERPTLLQRLPFIGILLAMVGASSSSPNR